MSFTAFSAANENFWGESRGVGKEGVPEGETLIRGDWKRNGRVLGEELDEFDPNGKLAG